MNTMKNRRIFSLAFSVLLISACQCTVVCGQESTTASPAGTPSAPLKGQLVEVQTTLNELRDARLAISRVRKAAANLYDEVTRQSVTMNYNPNLVGTTVIAMPAPSFSGGYLPARKKWIAASMTEIGPIMKLFKEDVDQAAQSDMRTDVGPNARKQLDPLREQAIAAVNSSFEVYKQLEALTSGQNYDNGSIASTTKALDKQIKQVDQYFKKAISIMQKDAKQSKKA
jgi:hypothetical protein